MEKRQQMKVCVLLYQWWRERNSVSEFERGRSSIELGLIVQSLNDEFLKESQSHTNINRERVQKWARPLEGVMKINVDGAFKTETGRGGRRGCSHQKRRGGESRRRKHLAHDGRFPC